MTQQHAQIQTVCEAIHKAIADLIESDQAHNLCLDDECDRVILRLLVSNAMIQAVDECHKLSSCPDDDLWAWDEDSQLDADAGAVQGKPATATATASP